MKNVKCIHPIKVNKIIKAFIENFFPEFMDIEIDWDNNSTINYAVCVEDDEITIYVPNWKKADFKNDDGGKYFRKDFIKRYASAKGFSDVTIALLHEIGHVMTKGDLPKNYSRYNEYNKINEIENKVERCFAYFKMLDETLATNWAIKWLENAENRKIAKAFEKKFWACFE